ncbi:hypothetical protein ZWY2020_016590 [Hordeum vulgare]|nr:hypothetical protein ZWY2020_016590 [Hordeum vulgare]
MQDAEGERGANREKVRSNPPFLPDLRRLADERERGVPAAPGTRPSAAAPTSSSALYVPQDSGEKASARRWEVSVAGAGARSGRTTAAAQVSTTPQHGQQQPQQQGLLVHTTGTTAAATGAPRPCNRDNNSRSRTHVFLLSARERAAAARLLAADRPHFAKRYVRTVADLLGEHNLLCTSHGAHRRTRRTVAGLFASKSTAAFATGSSFPATGSRFTAIRSTTPPPDLALVPPDASKNRCFFCHRALEVKREARQGEEGEE